MVGHSFGGKVALKYRENNISTVRLTWTLDSAPAPINPSLFDSENRSESVVRLKEVLRTLPPWKTKAELAQAISDKGFSPIVSQWMTTNVVSKPDKTVGFIFDLDMVDALFDDYCHQDMFPTLTKKQLDSQVHFLRAGRNRSMWTADVLGKFETLVDQDTVHLHTMSNAGHFVHAQSPEAVHQLMEPSFQSV